MGVIAIVSMGSVAGATLEVEALGVGGRAGGAGRARDGDAERA